nr:MAG TPA: hypothetical protein [Caudoviricetes sp.]
MVSGIKMMSLTTKGIANARSALCRTQERQLSASPA